MGIPIFKSRKDCYKYVEVHGNPPEMEVSVVCVAIVDVDKFVKEGYFWSNKKGNKINEKPFRRGDVGYIAIMRHERNVEATEEDVQAFEEASGVLFLRE